MHKKYRPMLTDDQRLWLKELIASDNLSPAAATHAPILLKADAAPGAPNWKDEQIADAFDCSIRTVVRVRQTFAAGGLQRAVVRKQSATSPPTLIDGATEAQLVTLACSAPPDGHARWTLRLLSDRLVAISDLESVSYETIRRTLKKT